MPKYQIPIIDLFAGPGGLSEGFHSLNGRSVEFSIAASFEKCPHAHQTLFLRSFFRYFEKRNVPEDYYRYLRGELSRDDLFERFPAAVEHASSVAHKINLGGSEEDKSTTDRIISNVVSGAEHWVLIGGPPCQAYSVAGRARAARIDRDVFEADERHFLYREYLRIIAKFSPSIFVMENVKGILSATHGGSPLFARLLQDLSDPASAIGGHGSIRRHHRYRICSFVKPEYGDSLAPADFVIRSEDYGIPQMRHRVILLGIRDDIDHDVPLLQPTNQKASISDVIGDLPRLRSTISRKSKASHPEWIKKVTSASLPDGLVWKQVVSGVFPTDDLGYQRQSDPHVRSEVKRALARIPSDLSCGGRFVRGQANPCTLKRWYTDRRIGGFLNHEARSHRPDDFARYLFVSCFGKAVGRSPTLHDFPTCLLPDHVNVGDTLEKRSGGFEDRFRVHLAEQPAYTIVSHISKDGHYYIHYDPVQCRSLTAREAARIQTFPDNYFFEGNRTSQYQQVGNAVPPRLAYLLARSVSKILERSANE